MTPNELDELESGLDPTARFIVTYLRQENTQLREQLAKLTEQVRSNLSGAVGLEPAGPLQQPKVLTRGNRQTDESSSSHNADCKPRGIE
jgi:hypothetical protein